MVSYDLKLRMNECFRELELATTDLTRFLDRLELLEARVFSLPEIEKGFFLRRSDRKDNSFLVYHISEHSFFQVAASWLIFR